MELINQLSADHLDHLYQLYRKEWWTDQRTREDTERIVSNSDIVLGLEEEGRLVGFLRVLTDYTAKAFVFDVIIEETYRGKGAGRQLMDALVNHEQLRDVAHIDLHCRPEVAPIYEKWGFTAYESVRIMRVDRSQR